MSTFNTLRLLRLRDILGDPKANPPVPAIIPVSKASWYNGIGKGIYPKSVPLGRKMVAWRYEDIARLVEQGIGAV